MAASMDEKPIVTKGKMTILSTICFGMGGMPYQICNTAINFYITIFLLEVVKLQPYEASIIVFSGKVWDAFTDPLCGFLVSRSTCRLNGRLKPWILFSAPLGCTMYFLFWYVPDIPREAYLPYYFACYCLFQTCMTAFQVPYTSLTMYLSDDQKERDRATAVRVFIEVTSIVIAVSVEGQLINLARSGSTCSNNNTTNGTLNGSLTTEDNLDAQKGTYMLGALIFCGLYVMSALIVFFGVKEYQGKVHEKPEPFFTSMKLVFKHGPYVKLVMACLFVFLAMSVVQGNVALYLTHSLGLGDHFANLILVLLGCTIVFIPFWHLIAIKFGKKISFGAGVLLQVPVLLSLFFIEGNLAVTYVIGSLAGSGLSVSFILPWSMLPDVLDEYMLKTGNRKDTLFYAFFVFLYKLASGVALGLSQLALQLGGYDSVACSQAPSVGLTLRVLLSPVPVSFYIIGLVILWFYPINKETRARTQKALEEMTSTKEIEAQADTEGFSALDNPAYIPESIDNSYM